jgi:hypothetical protein
MVEPGAELDHSQDEQFCLTNGLPRVVILAVETEDFCFWSESRVGNIDEISDTKLLSFLQLPREVEACSSYELNHFVRKNA